MQIRPLYFEGLNPKVPAEVRNLTLAELLRCASNPKGIVVFVSIDLRDFVGDMSHLWTCIGVKKIPLSTRECRKYGDYIGDSML
jgi:hypothetical protein